MPIAVVIANADGTGRLLRLCLAAERDVCVVAECETGKEALAAIHRFRPDVAFVSVRLPLLGGFQIATAVRPSILPRFVFMTDDPYEASQAFAYDALDCLPGPVTRQRVSITMRRVRERMPAGRLSMQMLELAVETAHETRRWLAEAPPVRRRLPVAPADTECPDELIVTGGRGLRSLPVAAVDYIRAKRNDVFVHAEGQRFLMRESLGSLAHRLGHSQLVRIHRGTMVNVARIEEIRRWRAWASIACLSDGTNLRIGRVYRRALDNVMGTIVGGG